MREETLAIKNIDYVYIGWPKSGSSWFHEACCAFPELSVLPHKSGFFSVDRSEKQVSLTGSSYSGIARSVDIDHDYVFSFDCLEKIRSHNPEVKVIIFLRYPIDWIWSEYCYATGTEIGEISFEKFILQYPYVLERSKYECYLQNVFSLFEEKNIFIGFLEDLRSNPNRFYRILAKFLGVSIQSVSFDPSVSVNAGARPRFAWVRILRRLTKKSLQYLGLDWFYNKLKRGVLRRAFFKKDVKPLEIQKERVRDILPDAIQSRVRLEGMLGYTLPLWRERESQFHNVK